MASWSNQKDAVRVVLGFYGFMSLAAIGLILWRADSMETDPWALPASGWPVHLLVTGLLVALVHLGTRWGMERFPALRRSGLDLRRMLGRLSAPAVFLFALASGVGEELLFRGWLLGEVGLFWSSLLFGLVHIPPNRKWLYWPFFAAAMGLVLGWLYLWSGSLVFPVLLHGGVNYFNLRLMMKPANPPAADWMG